MAISSHDLDRSTLALVLAGVAVVVVIFGGVLDATAAQLAVVAATFLVSILLDVTGEDDFLSSIGAGVTDLVGAAVLFWVVDAGATVTSILFLLGVRELASAAWTAWRGDETGESGGDFEELDGPVASDVVATLDEHPRTRRELWDLVDADADAVDRTLERLRADGVVVQAGSEFRLDPVADSRNLSNSHEYDVETGYEQAGDPESRPDTEPEPAGND